MQNSLGRKEEQVGRLAQDREQQRAQHSTFLSQVRRGGGWSLVSGAEVQEEATDHRG